MKMTRLRLKFLLPDVEAQQSCVWEGWGGAGCPELSSLQASCSGTTIFPLSQRGPARADRTPGVLSVTTVVTWLLSSVRGGGGRCGGDFFSGGPSPGLAVRTAGGRTSSCLGLSGQAALLCFHQEA